MTVLPRGEKARCPPSICSTTVCSLRGTRRRKKFRLKAQKPKASWLSTHKVTLLLALSSQDRVESSSLPEFSFAMVSLCSLGWPRTQRSPAAVPQMLVLNACAMHPIRCWTLCEHLSFCPLRCFLPGLSPIPGKSRVPRAYWRVLREPASGFVQLRSSQTTR